MVVPRDSFVTKCVSTARFFGQFIQHPKTIGAFSPSSKSLAKVIVSKIQKNSSVSPRRILEIGPGTGAFKDKIIKRMNPNDKLDLVELDKELADQLKTRYKGTPNVTVHCCSILDYTVPKNKRYDHIVSGLPLNAFSAKMVEEVFEKYRGLAQIGGTISYFEYLFLPTFQRVSLSKEKRANLDNILAQKASFFDKYGEGKTSVFSNFPPAQVVHHKIKVGA